MLVFKQNVATINNSSFFFNLSEEWEFLLSFPNNSFKNGQRNSITSGGGGQKNRKKMMETSGSKNVSKVEGLPPETMADQSTGVIDSSSPNEQSSKKGYSFKINESGRRYHGYDGAAYIFPNDDEGKYI
jgi:hypothetical protein